MAKSQAYRDDVAAATKAVYAAKGEGPCPFEPGSRRARLWEKKRAFYLEMEARFDDLAEAYGEFRPDRLGRTEATDA